jgi:hypothetical protein
LVDGRVGRAVRFRFEADAPSAFFTSNIHGKPEWDHAQGFSFWVRGNGSDGFGGLEFDSGDWSSSTMMTTLCVTTSAFR